MPELRGRRPRDPGRFEAHARDAARGWGRTRGRCEVPADLEGLDGLVIPGGESTTIVKGIESAGLEAAIRAHHEAGGPVFGTCAGMIVCDDAAPRPDRRDRAAQRLRPPAAELRGGPGGRGDRRRAAARGLHPRALGRAPRARGRGARRLRGAPGGGPRGERARLRLPPRADRRSAAARAVHGNDDRARSERAQEAET